MLNAGKCKIKEKGELSLFMAFKKSMLGFFQWQLPESSGINTGFDSLTIRLLFYDPFFYFTSNGSWHQSSPISWLDLQSLKGQEGPSLRTLGMYHFDVVGQRSWTAKRPNAHQRIREMKLDDS